jgi:lipoprotein-anchoring transpeptidase ErfK/SrfK
MRYFMRIVGGIGMHEGYLPGYPASHGCIRLPTKDGSHFLPRRRRMGTPVEIIGAGSMAAAEDAVPLGEGTVAVVPPVESAEVKKQVPSSTSAPKTEASKVAASPTKPAESIRRAIVADGKPKASKGAGSSLGRIWRKSPPPGTTLYLE